MKYQKVSKPAFLVAGKSLQTSQSDNAATGSVSAFWAQCNQDGTSEELVRLMRPSQIGDALLGVCYGSMSDGTFEYLISAEVQSTPQEAGLQTLKIPASNWLIFESIGPMPRAIQDLWQRIYTEYLPGSGYRHAGTPDLEVYYDGDTSAAGYRCEVWIPVVL